MLLPLLFIIREVPKYQLPKQRSEPTIKNPRDPRKAQRLHHLLVDDVHAQALQEHADLLGGPLREVGELGDESPEVIEVRARVSVRWLCV